MSATTSMTRGTTTPATAAARAEGVSKYYGTGDATIAALKDVSVSLDAGVFTAIMGPSGSGKSTLLHMLAGLDRPASGDVFLGDTRITSLNDKALTLLRRDQIGFIFQSFNLLPTMSAAENIVFRSASPAADRTTSGSSRSSTSWAHRPLSHRPTELSGGQQQRVAAARALASVRRSSSPTSPPVRWTPRRVPNSSASCARPSRNSARRS
jgi:putative ABC transport system ATP-binding protein